MASMFFGTVLMYKTLACVPFKCNYIFFPLNCKRYVWSTFWYALGWTWAHKLIEHILKKKSQEFACGVQRHITNFYLCSTYRQFGQISSQKSYSLVAKKILFKVFFLRFKVNLCNHNSLYCNASLNFSLAYFRLVCWLV